MPRATQLNVRLDNKVGALAGLCRDLADHGINLLAIAAPDITAKRGLIRLLVVNPELAQRKVAEMAYSFTVEEVLFVELKNRPGSIAKTMEKLARAGINIRYAYATAFRKSKKSGAVIAVAEKDLSRAHKLLG